MRFLLALLFFTVQVSAQVPGKIEDATIMPGRNGHINYVKNPSAIKNVSGVAVSNATISRSTSVKYNNIASFECNTTTNGGLCEHVINNPHDEDQVGNCAASFNYIGDGSLYSFQLLDGSSNLLDQRALSNVTLRTPVEIPIPCGASRKIRITQTTAGTSPAINYGLVTYSKWDGVGNTFVPEPWTAFTPVSSWTTNVTHTGRKRCIDPYNIQIQYKTALTGAPNALGLHYDMPPGVIVDTANLLVSGSNFVPVGRAMSRDLSPPTGYPGEANYIGASSQVTATFYQDLNPTTNAVGYPQVGHLAPFTFASGDSVNLNFEIPTLSCGHMQAVTTPSNSADLMGTVFYEESGTCPANSIKVDGSTLNATTHAALIARRTAKGIASPTVLPNLSGLFIRSAGTQTQGGVAHTAGALGAFQADQMQGHRHSVDIRPSGGSGAQPIPDGNNSGLGTTTFPSSTPVTDATNGTPRTGTTTRPANMAFTPCMWFVSNPAPLITNSVISSSNNPERVERVSISACTSSPCTITSQSGGVTSVTRSGVGAYVVNFSAGVFSSAPVCTVTQYAASNFSFVRGGISPTATAFDFIVSNTASSNVDVTIAHIMCLGPK